MKFYKDILLRGMVTEWSDKYVDYKKLKSQINLIKDKALTLAEAYSRIREITGEDINRMIDLKRVKEETQFWLLIDQQIKMVEDFYKTQVSSMLLQFHALTKQAIKLNLMTEYVPRQKNFSSRLDRELSRRKELKEAKISFITNTGISDHHDQQEEDNLLAGSESESFPLRRLRVDSQIELNDMENDPNESTTLRMRVETETIKLRKEDKKMSPKQLRDSFCEFYRGLVLLESYCELNHEAFRKVLKKFDKNFGTITQSSFLSSVIAPLDFTKHATAKLLITETEHVYSISFTEGRRTKAMDELRIPKHQKEVGLALFRFGVNIGIILPLFIVTLYNVIVVPKSAYERFDSVFIVFRMLGMCILMIWCWGFDMWVWTKYRVNYVFNSRSHVRYQNVLEGASLFTLLWLFAAFLYVLTSTKPTGFEWMGYVPYQLHSLLLIFLFIAAFLVFQVRSKFWLTKTLVNIVIAPFKEVVFRDFFLADQLASISIVLYDLEYTICFFLSDAWSGGNVCMRANTWTRPLIAALPAFWRFMQCLRRYRDSKDTAHLLNAGKYSTTFFVATFSALRANVSDDFWTLWIASLVISTIYTNYWDIFRDWGLGNSKAGYLRPKLLYGDPLIYYFAIASNFIMRLCWTLTVSPEAIAIIMNPNLFVVIISTVEILRRAQWNLFRLENEQLNNVGRFRAVNIVVPPSDQESVAPPGSSIHFLSLLDKFGTYCLKKMEGIKKTNKKNGSIKKSVSNQKIVKSPSKLSNSSSFHSMNSESEDENLPLSSQPPVSPRLHMIRDEFRLSAPMENLRTQLQEALRGSSTTKSQSHDDLASKV